MEVVGQLITCEIIVGRCGVVLGGVLWIVGNLLRGNVVCGGWDVVMAVVGSL